MAGGIIVELEDKVLEVSLEQSLRSFREKLAMIVGK
jgi:F0F1-type ATP synthase delta subunit